MPEMKVEEKYEIEQMHREEMETEPNMCFDCYHCFSTFSNCNFSPLLEAGIISAILGVDGKAGLCTYRDIVVSPDDTDITQSCKFFEVF